MSDQIITVCQHCGVEINRKSAEGAEGGISHGICPRCYPIEMEKIRKDLETIYGKKFKVPAGTAWSGA